MMYISSLVLILVLCGVQHGYCQFFTTRFPIGSLTTRNPISGLPGRVIVETYNNRHGLGAVRQNGINSASQCIIACQSNRNCRALDFNRNDNSCWHHYIGSGFCPTLRTKNGCKHYVIITCSQGRFLYGGTRRTQYSTVSSCISACTGTCKAVDFNFGENSCWHHTAATACSAPSSKPRCTHYKVMSCTGVTGSPLSTTIATTTTRAILRFDDMNIADGNYLPDIYPTLATCTSWCDTDPTCWAVDYNTLHQQCWYHNRIRGCLPLVSYPGVIHVKKDRC